MSVDLVMIVLLTHDTRSKLIERQSTVDGQMKKIETRKIIKIRWDERQNERQSKERNVQVEEFEAVDYKQQACFTS